VTTQQEISEETLEAMAAIAKAQTTGITTATGITSYDLSSLVSQVPVVTPFFDMIPTEKSTDGNKYAVWRAILNSNAAQPDPATPFDFAGSELVFSEQDFQAAYKVLSFDTIVTQDSYDLALGYADPFAVATFNLVNQMLIAKDRKFIGAQSFALVQPSAPSLTTAATGGTITSGTTVYVGVAARTGSGYYYGSGNSRGASASITAGTTTSTNKVTATVTSVRGGVCYDWFQSADGTTWYYYTTTTVNTVVMTKVIAANQALPSAITVPDLATGWKGTPGTVPTYNGAADNGSANAADMDGLLATLSGDYNATGQWVTTGTGTANPSINTSLDGAALTLTGGTITEIEQYLFLALWQSIKVSPTAIMVNAAQAQEIANLILGSNSATTFLNTDKNGRVDVVAGGRVGHVLNAPAGGIPVPIEVHVSLPPGTIAARSDRVPFPQANISSVLAYRALRDMTQFEYAASRIANTAGGGPRRETELRCNGAFVNRAPLAMSVLQNVG
jgi:hypothetical protein